MLHNLHAECRKTPADEPSIYRAVYTVSRSARFLEAKPRGRCKVAQEPAPASRKPCASATTLTSTRKRLVSEEQVQEALRLWRQGVTIRQIARRLGVNAATLHRYLRAANFGDARPAASAG